MIQTQSLLMKEQSAKPSFYPVRKQKMLCEKGVRNDVVHDLRLDFNIYIANERERNKKTNRCWYVD